VNEFNLYFGEFNSRFKLDKPLKVNGGLDRVSIPIPNLVKKAVQSAILTE
jgi:hypothetical protein